MADRISISIPEEDEELVEWVDKKVEDRRFRNRSEGFRVAVEEMKKNEEQDYNV